MGATDPARTREPQSGRGRDRCRLLRPKPALFSLQKDRWRHAETVSDFRKNAVKSPHAKEPVATSYSSPRVLAEAAHKTGRAKDDFELREIGREEYERLRLLLHL